MPSKRRGRASPRGLEFLKTAGEKQCEERKQALVKARAKLADNNNGKRKMQLGRGLRRLSRWERVWPYGQNGVTAFPTADAGLHRPWGKRMGGLHAILSGI